LSILYIGKLRRSAHAQFKHKYGAAVRHLTRAPRATFGRWADLTGTKCPTLSPFCACVGRTFGRSCPNSRGALSPLLQPFRAYLTGTPCLTFGRSGIMTDSMIYRQYIDKKIIVKFLDIR
jgi:hypothetical protein